MNLDSDDLLAQMKQDWPLEFEVSSLRALVRVQQLEIDRLNAVQGSYDPSVPRPFLDPDGGRHG
uniref:hypothetical protein n=1 Tax=Paractinoplanes polyasparticus TaxID=2856853 RepID=UPI001C84B779|nr:hypothetical protein [Actinoplanes polyasparticus]